MPNTAEICNLNTGQSIYKVAREIKKQEHSCFNCLCSIAEDASFVNEIRVLYPDLPLVANLRCGLWYTTNPTSTPTCYFKSTDGHQNTLNFSTTRLNWHIAELAAKRGGVLIVDATRKGKRFPDAFSKTVPIWAAVINRAIARVRFHDAQKEQRRRTYASPSGEVLTPVADTQTSISVRHADTSVRSTPAAAITEAAGAAQQYAAACGSAQCASLQLADDKQHQQERQQVGDSPGDSSPEHVEHLLVDCMADSMELLSGLTISIQRPSTPELLPSQSSGSQHQQQQLIKSSGSVTLTGTPYWTLGAPLGSPVGRCSSGLQRSLSLHISPQPSLQEWLDADALQRLTAAGLHPGCCFSPASRRAARISCHSIMGAAGVNALGDMTTSAAQSCALFASSAPAVSCLLDEVNERQPSSPRFSCIRAVASVTPCKGVQPLLDPEPEEELEQASPGFNLTTGPAAEPVTPRLGCCGALPVAFGSIHAALQHPSASPAVAVPAAGQSGNNHRRSKQHKQGHAVQAEGGTAMVAAAAGDAAGEFAFPSARLLAQSASSGLSASDCSPMSAAVTGSTASSCGSGLVAPDMPVVVLNGTSHQPGDAASILDIWRSTDLEDVASLPGIANFVPGVYHIPERQSSLEDDGIQLSRYCHQQQQQLSSKCTNAECEEGEVVFQDCWEATAPASSGPAASVSSADSSSSWVDEESGLGCDGLCAFAPPPVVPSKSAKAVDISGCEQQRPTSPSACSTCSSDSRFSYGSSKLSSSSHAAAAGSAGCVQADAPWDTSLHLPLWVPANERQAIEAKLDGFVERLLEVGADVRGLAAQLQKPLRPLWVSQDSLIWTNQVAQPSSLPFTPLLLVSASQPHQCERQAARAAWQQHSNSQSSVVAEAAPLHDLSDSSDTDSDDEPRVYGRANSSKAAKIGKAGPIGKPKAGAAKPNAGSGSPDKQAVSRWSYVYIPGAGDDEESWSCGLTPALFWDNCSALLSCGPAGLVPAVKQLVQQQRSMTFGGPASGITSIMVSQQQQSKQVGRRAQRCVATDQHHLAPQGCVTRGAQADGMRVVPAAPGAFWLGSTGLAVGNLEGASAAEVWRAVDAVLCCGSAVPAILQQEYKAMQMSTAGTAAIPTASALSSSAPAGLTWQPAGGSNAAEACLCFRPTFWPSSNQLSSSYSSCSDWARQQQQQQQLASAVQPVAPQESSSLELGKVDVTPAAVVRPKKKGGMLAELLKKETVVRQPSATQHNRSNSSDSVTSCSSAGSSKQGNGTSSSSSVSCLSTCTSSYSSCSEDSDASAAEPASLARLKWVPIQSAKRDRLSLKQHLQEALEFVSAHLAAGHLVLLHDPDGHDTCVCVAIATLLACFTTPEAGNDAAAAVQSSARFVAAWPDDSRGQGKGVVSAGLVPAQHVTKHSVRQQLAFVSAAYPDARPTRGMLKQVFNFFEDRRRAGVAAAAGPGH